MVSRGTQGPCALPRGWQLWKGDAEDTDNTSHCLLSAPDSVKHASHMFLVFTYGFFYLSCWSKVQDFHLHFEVFHFATISCKF